MKKKFSAASIVFGLTAIGIGLGYLGNSLNWWHGFSIFFNGWWSLFIIIPCLIAIIDNGFKPAPTILLIVGIMLLISGQIRSLHLGKLIIPFILISVGLVMILRNSLFRFRRIVSSNGEIKYLPTYNTFLHGRNVTLNGDIFDGGSVYVFLGGLNLDISNTVIENDVILDINTVICGAYIHLPSDVNVKINASQHIGKITNHLAYRNIDGAHTVFITGSCVFGDIDVS